MEDTHETIVSIMATQRRALLEQVKQLELMVAQNYPLLFNAAVMVMSMRMTDNLRTQLVDLKNDWGMKQSRLVARSAFYRNHRKLVQRADEALMKAKNKIFEKYEGLINCSFCGRVGHENETCQARNAEVDGSAPIITTDVIKINNAKRVYRNGAYRWQTKWVSVPVSGNHKTVGGIYLGSSALDSEMRRELGDENTSWLNDLYL